MINACPNHPAAEANHACADCKRAFCANCVVPLERLWLCADCKDRFLAAGSEEPTVSAPEPSTEVHAPRPARPRPRKAASPVPWIVGVGALVATAVFAFVVATRLAAPLLDDRRAEKLSAALSELAKIGVALEQHRIEKGMFPEALDDLVPDFLPSLPSDPYSKGPPVYRHDGDNPNDRILLYSVGPDGKDNDGQPYDGGSRKGDLLYLVR